MKEKRYFTVDGNEEIFIDDTLEFIDKEKTEYGSKMSKETINVTEESLAYLLEKGLVTTRPGKRRRGKKDQVSVIEDDVVEMASDVLATLAMSLDWDIDEVAAFLEVVNTLNPASYRGIVHGVVADLLEGGDDKPYYVSIWNNEVKRARREICEDGMAAFRSQEDAALARDVANELVNCFEN